MGVAEPGAVVDRVDLEAIAPAERQVRTNLAAAYRLVDHFFATTDGIYNHLSCRVPGEPDRFLIKRHALLYREVTASNLAKVDMAADLDERAGVNRPGFVLHSGLLSARPDVNCVMHLHGPLAIAMSARADGLKMMSQAAIRFHRSVGYHPFEGITEHTGEQARIAEALGDNQVLFLRNHGVVIVGATVRDAFERTRDLMTACESQLLLEAAGAEIIEVSEAICEAMTVQLRAHDAGRGRADWPAWLRLMDAVSPGYAA